MTCPLAVFAPIIGARSEMLIRRHMQDLLPGKTAVIVNSLEGPDLGHWQVDCPLLVLDGLHPISWPPHVAHIAGITQFLRDHRVEVVLGEYLNISLPIFALCRELGIRFVVQGHGYEISSLLHRSEWRQAYLHYNAAEVVTVSEVSRKRLIALGLNAEQVHVVPVGVDVPAKLPRRRAKKTIRCVAVGRFVPKKAPLYTLDVFRRVVGVYPDLHLDFIGTGALLPEAEQFVDRFGLGRSVTLHGAQPHDVVLEFMQRADIFLQHSITDPVTGDQEGLPATVLEAMAHGLPVVSTHHAGIPEAVVDGVTGYLVDEGDLMGMAERLVYLICDPDLRYDMGKAGWCRAKTCFAWEKARVRLLEIIGVEG